jgi:two-component system phosphate regulon sensor histidine kinase PhoR
MYGLGDGAAACGKLLAEAIRDSSLQDFVRHVWAMREESEVELALGSGRSTTRLAAVGSLLRDADDQEIGVLVMLRDVTHVRMLERIRRDFVANVSHELKTPITSIQGFVETLREGAMSDPETAARFLEIIGRQSERLSAIIDDLLSLSRIEQEGEKGQIEMVGANLSDVVHAAVTLCQAKAEERRIRVDVECPPQFRARINPQLVEQALSNLLDNAVKYSEPEQSVVVRARSEDRDLVIDVVDRGCGIPEEHLDRIFERFYRVDKARSRKMGGTGLGLAIVKHIAQAHGGRVTVTSREGQGSTFTMRFPGAVLGE